jgi:hypothetical protein
VLIWLEENDKRTDAVSLNQQKPIRLAHHLISDTPNELAPVSAPSYIVVPSAHLSLAQLGPAHNYWATVQEEMTPAAQRMVFPIRRTEGGQRDVEGEATRCGGGRRVQ